MKGNELVWRTLVDRAFDGVRSWKNVGDLAFESGVAESTAYLALDKLRSIGAVTAYPGGGLSVTSPEKTLTMLCSRRDLARDTVAMTSIAGVTEAMERGRYAIGGPDAAKSHLGDVHVSDYSDRIMYLTIPDATWALPAGNEVRVLIMDARAEVEWSDGYASKAQTIADLFATPGWQASEYRVAMMERFVQPRDWDGQEVRDA